jgi:transposase-like protein
MANEDLKAAQARTKQALSAVRATIVAEAQEIADRAGSKAILVSRLAQKHGVASLSVKRWLEAAGFELRTDLRGRPRYEEVLLHDGLVDALNAIKSRQQ